MPSRRTGPLIATLTVNPAIDLSFFVERLAPSEKLRCEAVRRDAGGGGLNAGRVIRRLGGRAVAVFPAGGANGARLRALLEGERMPHQACAIAGETREDITAEVRANGEQYRFVMPGPRLVASEWRALLRTAASLASKILVASGSLPPGVPITLYGRLAGALRAAGVRLALDASGPALKHGLAAGVWLAKPNLAELEGLVGERLPDLGARLAACRSIVARGGAEMVALSMGADGAMLVSNRQALIARAPAITPVTTVGAGDTFTGALVLGLARGEPEAAALRRAVAAGSAALLAPGTQLCLPADVRRLEGRVCVSAL